MSEAAGLRGGRKGASERNAMRDPGPRAVTPPDPVMLGRTCRIWRETVTTSLESGRGGSDVAFTPTWSRSRSRATAQARTKSPRVSRAAVESSKSSNRSAARSMSALSSRTTPIARMAYGSRQVPPFRNMPASDSTRS
jgi:hypothetical protein